VLSAWREGFLLTVGLTLQRKFSWISITTVECLGCRYSTDARASRANWSVGRLRCRQVWLWKTTTDVTSVSVENIAISLLSDNLIGAGSVINYVVLAILTPDCMVTNCCFRHYQDRMGSALLMQI
jgi:hypothetical protein